MSDVDPEWEEEMNDTEEADNDAVCSDPDFDPELMNEDLGITRGVPKGRILHNLNNYI